MTELLFNAPLWIIVILAVLGVGLLIPSLRMGDARLRNAAMGCFAAAILLLGFKLLLPTDQKRAEKQTRRLAEAIGKSDWPTVSTLLRNATLLDWHGQDLADTVKRYCDLYKLKEVRVNSVESVQTTGVITVTLSVTSMHEGGYVDSVPSTWNMDWQKRSDGWILTDIRAIRIGTWTGDEAESFLKKGP